MTSGSAARVGASAEAAIAGAITSGSQPTGRRAAVTVRLPGTRVATAGPSTVTRIRIRSSSRDTSARMPSPVARAGRPPRRRGR